MIITLSLAGCRSNSFAAVKTFEANIDNIENIMLMCKMCKIRMQFLLNGDDLSFNSVNSASLKNH